MMLVKLAKNWSSGHNNGTKMRNVLLSLSQQGAVKKIPDFAGSGGGAKQQRSRSGREPAETVEQARSQVGWSQIKVAQLKLGDLKFKRVISWPDHRCSSLDSNISYFVGSS